MLKYLKPTIFPSEIISGYTEINDTVFTDLPNGLDFKIRNKETFEASLNALSTGLSLDKNCLTPVNQMHLDNVLLINEKLADFTKLEADAIITQNKEIIPSVRTADCGNILLYDPNTKTRAAIHSGYHGTNLNILGKTLKFMNDLGVNSNDVLAFVGPSIGQNALWVWQSTGKNCPEEFKVSIDKISFDNHSIFHKYLSLAQNEIQNFPESEKPGFFVDLNGWLKCQLLQAGLQHKNIEVCKINTFEDKKFHSQRRFRMIDKNESYGLGMGFIAIK